MLRQSTNTKRNSSAECRHLLFVTGTPNTLQYLLTVLLLITAALCFSGKSHATEIYKWVDEQGVTHYSARPPENQENYEEIKVRRRNAYRTHTPTTSAATSDADNTATEDEEESFTEPGREVSVDNPDKIAENCARARQNINTINSKRRVLLDDGQGGKRRLSDEEREALMKESQDFLDRWCDDS